MSLHTKIINFMTPFPHSIRIDDTLLVAQSVMEEHGVRHLPVKHENEELAGIISQQDILLALSISSKTIASEDLRVSAVYTPSPYTADVNADIREVLTYMIEAHIGSALITRHGKLAGIFTFVDAGSGFIRLINQVAGDYAMEPDVA